jgi:signal transduction histidine kinase
LNSKKDYKLSFLLGIIILVTNFLVITPIIFLQYQSSTAVFQKTLEDEFTEEVKLSSFFLEADFNTLTAQTKAFSKNNDLIKQLEGNEYSKVKQNLEYFQQQVPNIDFMAIHRENEKELIDVSLNLLEDQTIFTDYIYSRTSKGSSLNKKGNTIVFFTSSPITSRETGRVLGKLHTGIILNNNLELISKISESLGNKDLYILSENKLVVSSKSLKESNRSIIANSNYHELISLAEDIYYKRKLIFDDVSLTVVVHSDKTVLKDLRKNFLRALIFTLFITIILSISAVFIANKSLLPPLNRLLNYLENSVRDEEHKVYQKSSIKEFNLISESFSEVFKNLTRKKGQVNKMIDSSNLPSIIINNNFDVIRFNQSAKELLGITHIDQSLKDDTYLSSCFQFKDLVERAISGQEISNEEVIFKSNEQWVYTSWSMSVDMAENIIFAQCIDNTEKVLSVKEIEAERSKSIHNQKLAALGEVAGSIAHEVNNPMGVIALSLSLIEDEVASLKDIDSTKKELIKRYLQNIDDSVDRTTSIVSHFLDFSRDSKKDKQEIKSIKETFDKTFIFIEEKIKRNKINLKINIPDKKVTCYIKETQFSQVMVNLINNSIDALLNSSIKKIKIDCIEVEDFVEIHIVDSGPGIEQNLKDTIFNPFFTTKPKGKGTGLGLSISKSIIEEMSGKLELKESEVGAHFVIHLPKKAS